MKRMNRVLSLLLVLCMIATLLPAQVLATDVEQATATPITGEDRLQAEALPEALPQEAQAEQAATPEVTAKEIENPGVDLKRDQAGQQMYEALYDEDETVRVIVVLEEEALLDQGFTTDQIAAKANLRDYRLTLDQLPELYQVDMPEFGEDEVLQPGESCIIQFVISVDVQEEHFAEGSQTFTLHLTYEQDAVGAAPASSHTHTK